MKRYAIWDKASDIYTLGRDAATGKQRWTAREYIDSHAQWADNPQVKVIVGGGVINGTVFMEFTATVDHYKKMGAQIEDGMSDAEVLAAIEEFEDRPPEPGEPSPEERIAAALEFKNLLEM
jgi:hypothetical protein